MEPVRTCVGCRRREPRSVLLRVVAGDDGLVADVAARLPGRGAWVHPATACVEQAVHRRAFTRALRLSTGLDATALLGAVAAGEGSGPSLDGRPSAPGVAVEAAPRCGCTMVSARESATAVDVLPIAGTRPGSRAGIPLPCHPVRHSERTG